MRELCCVMESLLPPDSVPPAQGDLEVMVVGSQRKVNIMGSPRGAGMSPSEHRSEQQRSVQNELNELNPNRGKQHGHGQGRAHQQKHTMF